MKRAIDQILNQMSMYRLLSAALTTLWIFSLYLSLFGQLTFSPLELVASAAVLILSAYGFNVLFGWLFDVRTHDESSFITAFILFFLFNPSTNPSDLAALALVAMMAMGTKYILAIKGRHIFNPAAAGAVIVGMVGVTYATWWVATPVLIPVTLLFAFLILYKTRRLTLGVIFLAIATPLIVILSMLNGQPLLAAVTSLASWPLLFFVGFMLSEPLTLPPRRWQRYLVGIIVAVLFAVPLSIGELSSSPALALVIGNLIAFIFTQRKHIQLTFKERRRLSPSSEEYVFETRQPLAFTAGQYMEITIPHAHKDGRGIRRIFSIVSPPGESIIRFGIKMFEQPSTFKNTLRDMQPGTTVDATGIGGDFVLPKDTAAPLLFVAGGIGITPFISHLRSMQDANQAKEVVLIYAASSVEELAYADIIEASGIRVIAIANTNKNIEKNNWTILDTQRITDDLIKKYVPDVSDRNAYISGPPQMVDSTKAILKKMQAKHITCDYFTGY
jgi:ferredoxin-NADP reductase/Na+-translocating ferredoxin:NAD+ oxidoreductase RnfD subunit